MKTLKRMLAAILLALMASPTVADRVADRVYRATKPYWWSEPAMKCYAPNPGGTYWCGAGAWQIGKLQGAGEDSLAAWGYAGYQPDTRAVGVSIVTNFHHREVSFTCSGQTEPLQVRRERTKGQYGSAIIFEYWTWAPRARIEACLRKPLKMTVDGRNVRGDRKVRINGAEQILT